MVGKKECRGIVRGVVVLLLAGALVALAQPPQTPAPRSP
jgi:hypothetical protein